MENETLNDIKAERDRLKEKYETFVHQVYYAIRDIFWYEQMTAERTEDDEPNDDKASIDRFERLSKLVKSNKLDELKDESKVESNYFCEDDSKIIKNLTKQIDTYIQIIYFIMSKNGWKS